MIFIERGCEHFTNYSRRDTLSEVKCYHNREIGNVNMKNLKMFFMRHLGLILTMIAGHAGMHASCQSDFEKCMETKKALIDICSTNKIDRDFVRYYTTKNNPVFIKALQACVFVRSGVDYIFVNFDNQQKYENELASEIAVDYNNITKAASQVRCDQVRKDFVAGLASVQSEENKAGIIKAFESSLADCK